MATNTGTSGTKEISKEYGNDGVGDVTNLIPESSTVLSKERVGIYE